MCFLFKKLLNNCFLLLKGKKIQKLRKKRGEKEEEKKNSVLMIIEKKEKEDRILSYQIRLNLNSFVGVFLKKSDDASVCF